jgi:hypothetical protein
MLARIYTFLIFILLFFLWGSGLRAYKVGALPFGPHFQFALVILEMGSCDVFAWLALNHDPLDLSLPTR